MMGTATRVVDRLADQADVAFTDPADGEALLYEAATGTWINGEVSGGGASSPLTLTAATTNETPLTVEAIAGQTANLQEWYNGSGALAASISSTGRILSQSDGISDPKIDVLSSDSGGIDQYGFLSVSNARGSIASPTHIWSGRAIAGIHFRGYESFTPGYTDAFRIVCYNESGTWSSASAVDTQLRMYGKRDNVDTRIATFSPNTGAVFGDGSATGSGTLGVSKSTGKAHVTFRSGSTTHSVGINGTDGNFVVSMNDGGFLNQPRILVTSFGNTYIGSTTNGSGQCNVNVGGTGPIQDLVRKLATLVGDPALRIVGGSAFAVVQTVLHDNGGAVFNEQGNDSDVRIEGTSDANLVRVDASENRVGIGIAEPASKLTVAGDAEVTGSANGMILQSPDDTRWRVTVDNNGTLSTTAVV
jgi:hypothetical protein